MLEGMLRCSTLVLVALLLGTICQAPICQAQNADVADQRTIGHLNGRFWSSVDGNWKLAFIMGFCEAAECPKQSNYGEIVNGIDVIYHDPENMRLPIGAMMKVFTMKVTGRKATEVEAFMNAIRAYVDEPVPKVVPSPPPTK
jgi:hypothetical protein